MTALSTWLAERWLDVGSPVAVFVAALAVGLWLRGYLYGRLERWARRAAGPGSKAVLLAVRRPSVLWTVIVSVQLGLTAAVVPEAWQGPIAKGLWSLLYISLTLAALRIARGLIQLYGERLGVPERTLRLVVNATYAAIVVLVLLLLLGLWGAPISPILLVIGIAGLAAVLALRDVLPNSFAWIQLSTTAQIKVGDFIKMESGEQGYVTDISWRNTRIRTLEESIVLVPNSRLVSSVVINYGRPLKKAQTPFRFYARAHLKELTGLRARNLEELAAMLPQMPDSVIYYHTHHFLEEHHDLVPEPPNDFAVWVRDALGDEVLGERLATIDTFESPSLGALRERVISTIREYRNLESQDRRSAPEGREFHFIKSVSVILPTPYVAHDLREFVEALRKLSLSSLYFHIFESRLRLGRASNDFSLWLEDSLEEPELAERVAGFDPYSYTLEGLRSALIQLIEKRIK